VLQAVLLARIVKFCAGSCTGADRIPQVNPH